MSDLVSVIVPIYNVEQYLERCIKSIQNQTYKNLEIILVDDGSPDKCGEICDRYEKEDARIKVIHKVNGGLSDARNVALDIALGEYFMLVDSDDWIHNQTIDVLMKMVNIKKCDLAICNYQYAYENKDYVDEKLDADSIVENFELVDNYTAQDIYFTNPDKRLLYTVAWNKLYHRSLFKEIRYPKGKVHEDEYTTFKLLHEAKRIGVVDTKLYYYFVRSDSIMGEFKASRFDAFDGYLEKTKKYVEWNESELAEKSLIHAMHMLLQYQKWVEECKTDLDVLIKKYRSEICNIAKNNKIKLKSNNKIEFIMFKYFYNSYYTAWKMKHR